MSLDPFHRRVINLNSRPVISDGTCVIYWMQRSQRARDNLALKFAVELANSLRKPVVTYFGLFDRYPMASHRAFKFMLEGLKETALDVRDQGIGFALRRENPSDGVVSIAEEINACAVVVDEDYLNVGRGWRTNAASHLQVRLFQVDAETVVPARITDREEWEAYTLRPKILRLLPE